MVKYRATCPVCGVNLMKGAPNSEIEVNCPRCKEYLWVAFDEAGVRATALARKTAPTAPRCGK